MSKLDPQGNFIWAKKLQGLGSSIGQGITLDNSGNIVVTGNFRGSKDFDVGTGIFSLTAVNSDIFILKLDQNGNFLWAK